MKPADHGPDFLRSTAEFMVPQSGFRLAPDVHAWLDTGHPVHAPRRGDSAHDVEFWNRLEADIAERRRVRTPIHLQRAVMDALTAGRAVAAPWHRRAVTLSPALVALGGAALLVLGVALGIALT